MGIVEKGGNQEPKTHWSLKSRSPVVHSKINSENNKRNKEKENIIIKILSKRLFSPSKLRAKPKQISLEPETLASRLPRPPFFTSRG